MAGVMLMSPRLSAPMAIPTADKDVEAARLCTVDNGCCALLPLTSVSSAAARGKALHVAAVQPAASRATLSGVTIECNTSSSSPAILYPLDESKSWMRRSSWRRSALLVAAYTPLKLQRSAEPSRRPQDRQASCVPGRGCQGPGSSLQSPAKSAEGTN
jgi:hypothetical protein